MSRKKQLENPLVSNRKLKQMYVAMVEAKLLDDYTSGPRKKARLSSTRGQEASRVSTAIDLTGGDLVSDAQNGVVMDLIAGASVGSLLKRLDAVSSGATSRGASSRPKDGARRIPWIEDAGERLRMALGAALAFRTQGRANIVVAYVYGRELPDAVWKRVLGLAAKFDLPIIFVALPQAGAGKSKRSMSAKALACGVPGFPVDANDAVALYRVAQESIARTRGDGGPVLIECLTRTLASERRPELDDSIVQMKHFMLARKVATNAWLDSAGRSFRRRLDTGVRRAGARK